MMKEQASARVIELAKAAMQLLERLQPAWEHGYFRFYAEPDSYGSAASYTHGGKVELLDALAQGRFFDAMNDMGVQLLASTGKETGVFLLTVDKDYTYRIEFDYEHAQINGNPRLSNDTN